MRNVTLPDSQKMFFHDFFAPVYFFTTFAAIMNIRKITTDTLKVLMSLALGGAILFWMYRDFDFQQVKHVLMEEMDWTWMLLSFPFCVLAQAFRGLRWKQTLEPIGEKPRTSVSIYSIFLSYAVSLLIPRIGEFARCGVLKRYDRISFSKALGTVVTERAIDSLLVLLIAGTVLLLQLNVFTTFFAETGTSLDAIVGRFTTMGWIVTAICGVACIILLYILLRNLSIYNKVKATLGGIWQGIISLKEVRNVPLFIFFTIGIWVSYFLHYYLTFFCFDFTKDLGMMCALVTFILGSMAVVVPTPNGAGPWHFAVKTMLILYGVADQQALYFVLIVHTLQTLMVVALGVYGAGALGILKRKEESGEGERIARIMSGLRNSLTDKITDNN